MSIQNTRNNHKKHWDTRGRSGAVNKAGYRIYSVGSRGDNIRTYEHVIVMEKYLGRKLSPNECVHHIDGNKLNNNIENLQLMERSKHLSMHALYTGLGKDRVGKKPANAIDRVIVRKLYKLLNEGLHGNAIAKELGISCSTVSNYKIYKEKHNAYRNS